MQNTMSLERRKLLSDYGAELQLTDGKLGMKGAVLQAEKLVKNIRGAFMPQQFDNPSIGSIQLTMQEECC